MYKTVRSDFIEQRDTGVRGGLSSRGMVRGREGMNLTSNSSTSGYMMPPPTLLPPHLSGRWMGGISPGLGAYSRRDIPGRFVTTPLVG